MEVMEGRSVEELESYAVKKSEETTNTVQNCLRIAEDMRGVASNTLITLHQQRHQIYTTHDTVVQIDHHLSRGEKLLGGLGGIFSKPWKAKSRKVTGPVYTTDDSVRQNVKHMEQKKKLGLVPAPTARHKTPTSLPKPTNAMQIIEYEKAKQDEGLSDLSNALEEMKEMAIEMGKELDGHIGALRPIDRGVDELLIGVEHANERGRILLRN